MMDGIFAFAYLLVCVCVFRSNAAVVTTCFQVEHDESKRLLCQSEFFALKQNDDVIQFALG